MGWVYRKDDKYLKCRKIPNHVGQHNEAEWVDDVNDSTVFYVPPVIHGTSLKGSQLIEATEKRTVQLTGDC